MSAASSVETSAPTTADVSASLEKSLKRRPDVAPIKVVPVAGRLAASAHSLERKLIANKLSAELGDETRHDEARRVMVDRDIAPRVRAQKRSLERNMTKDRIARLLSQRESVDTLEDRNIRRGGVANSIAPAQERLKRRITSDRINRLLGARGGIDALESRRIISDSDIAPSIASAHHTMERKFAKTKLFRLLSDRPDIDELRRRGVYLDMDPTGRDLEFAYEGADVDAKSGVPFHARRSRAFHLNLILLKFAASMGDSGELSLRQKDRLKDLIVAQNADVLAVAEQFDHTNNLSEFKEHLILLSSS